MITTKRIYNQLPLPMTSNLIEILKAETETLRIQYLNMTREWSITSYNRTVEKSKWNERDWCKYFNLTPVMVNAGTYNEFLSFPDNFYNTRKAREYDKEKSNIIKVLRLGKDNYININLKLAEDHYQNSILKLAQRIMKKELNPITLKIKTAHVGVNIETVLSDGIKTVKAWTIIASGIIQRPHYRYLIK